MDVRTYHFHVPPSYRSSPVEGHVFHTWPCVYQQIGGRAAGQVACHTPGPRAAAFVAALQRQDLNRGDAGEAAQVGLCMAAPSLTTVPKRSCPIGGQS